MMSASGPATPAMQRYSAEIYRLQEHQEYVPLSEIAEHVEASIQAVSRMVKRLREDGYLAQKMYQGVRLTSQGEKIAMPAIRRHRLAEVFLVKIMGYDWADAHDLTEIFVKGVNDELEDRMDELSGFPNRCPHGEPIPSSEGIMPEVNDRPLVGLNSGVDVTISRVRTHDMDKLRYIAELGLVPGRELSLLSCAPFKGPLRLRDDRQDHVIGYELAASLWVEV
jgi:DtxR family Mn-dependent transcriptional regulator